MPEPTVVPSMIAQKFRSLVSVLPTATVALVTIACWFLIHRFNEVEREPPEEMEIHSTDVVMLSAAKLDAAKLESEPALSQPMQDVYVVPGRIRYDEAKHIEVKAPMDGILAEVLVTPGHPVELGQLIAVIRTAEIGQARAAIVKQEQQRQIAARTLQRETTTASNLSLLTSMLDQGKSMQSIGESLNSLELGSYRQEILSTYSKMLLSSELLAKIEPLANSGSIAGRLFRERETERQLAETAFRTARDQAKYQAEQAKLKAAADLSEAERQCELAWKTVEDLLGYKEDRENVRFDSEAQLSRLEIRAPIRGYLESRAFSNNERISRGESLFVLANTDSFSVTASIREGEWEAVSLQRGTVLSVSIPALNHRSFPAKVHYVGREVQTETNSIPLVATLENCDSFLRPGMFVRVTIPKGPVRYGLSIKPEAVVQHDNQPFVFLDMKREGFKKVDVTLGNSTDDWVEVTHGLQEGQLVVTRGAFLLKSELLLKGETE
jgi:cobalt-zinc-cadmium efflux system membrane fusion protein